MSRTDGILVCVVSRAPFELFDAGIKGAEYRRDHEGRDGWARRLLSTPTLESILSQKTRLDEVFCDRKYFMGPEWFHDYHTLRVPLGYQHGRPVIDMPIAGIDWGMPNPAWTCGIIEPRPCFRIAVDVAKRRRIA